MPATDNNHTDYMNPYLYDESLDIALHLSSLGLSPETTASPPPQYLDSIFGQATQLQQQPLLDLDIYGGAGTVMMTPETYYPMFSQQQQQPYYNSAQVQSMSVAAAAGAAAAASADAYHMQVPMTQQIHEAELLSTINRTITFATPIIPTTGVSGQAMVMPSTSGGPDAGPLLLSRQHQVSRSNSRSSMSTNLTKTNSRGSGCCRSSNIRSRNSSYSSGSVTLYSDHKSHLCFMPGCSATFSRRRDMLRHLIACIHSPLEKSFKHICDYCNKEYTRKDSLRRHQKKNHPDLVLLPSS